MKRGSYIRTTEIRKTMSESAHARTLSDEGRAALCIARAGEKNPNYGKHHSPETLKKISDGVKKNRGPNTPEITQKKSKSMIEAWNNNPERKLEAANRARQRERTEEERIKLSESQILAKNDIWYGGVTYPDIIVSKYCERWNADLRRRIRLFWNNKSVLSGITKEENGRNLSCHHVYYQKKACCEWDNDTNGFYCFIDRVRYNIIGDPNKFVTLTSAENTMVNFDKMKWIKIFEQIIEENGGESYIKRYDNL
jgi:hypothetical protein